MTIAPIINAWITDNPLCRRPPVVLSALVVVLRPPSLRVAVTLRKVRYRSPLPPSFDPTPGHVCARRGLATRDFRWIPANNMTWLVRRSLNRWFAYGFVTLLDRFERCVSFSYSFFLLLLLLSFSRRIGEQFFDWSSFGIIKFYTLVYVSKIELLETCMDVEAIITRFITLYK